MATLITSVVPTSAFGRFGISILGVALALASSPAHAATWWWNSVTTGLWTNGSTWSSAATGGTTGTAPTNDTSSDVVVFNTTGTNGTVVAQLSQDQSLGGITVNNTGATTIQSSTSATRTFTLGAGGITINSGAGAFTIGATGSAVNVALAASQSWTNNSSNTFTALGGITSSAAGLQTLTIAGSGNTALSGIVGDGSGTVALTKSGNGTLTMTAANTYSGTTNILGGTFTLNGASGKLQNTAAVNVAGNATFNLGDGTAGNGLADRINTAAALTLGGTSGAGSLAVVRGSTTANNQTFSSLSVGGGGLSTISSATNTGGTPTVTFNGATPYQRAVAGGVVNFNIANVTVAFGTTAPSGAGNVAGISAPILVGVFLSGTNFVASGTGAIAAATPSTAWGNDVNLNLTADVSAGSGNVNAIRFADDTTARTLTLQSSGTTVVASGMILSTGAAVGSNATSGPTISGGALTSGNGRDLIIYDNRATLDRRSGKTYGVRVTSTITDNGATPVAVTVSGPSQSAATATLQGELSSSKVFLSGTNNSYSGGTFLNGGGLGISTDRSLGAVPTSATNNVYAMSGVSGLTNESGGVLTLDAKRWIVVNTGAALSLLGGSGWNIQGNISGGGNLYINDASGGGTSMITTITGTSTLSGFYSVTGILRATEGVGLSSVANLALGDNGIGGVLETSGTFTRAPGSGAGQVQIGAGAAYTNSAGFAAYGGNLTLNFGNDLRTMTFGTATGIANATTNLWLQTATATGTLTWLNPIDLNGSATRTIRTDGSLPAIVSGAISGAASSNLAKTGTGTLILSGTNSFGGKTIIQEGAVSVAVINNASMNGNLGTNATIDLGGSTTTGALLYTGAGETTNRVVNLSGTTGGGTLDQSGSNSLRFTANFTTTGAGPKTLTLQGSSAGTGELAGTLADGVTGTTSLTSQFVTGATTITLNSVVGIVTGAAISGANIPANTTVTAVNTSTRVVTLSQATTTGTTAAGSLITVAGVTNANSLTKAGTGTWTLSGTNSYTGITTINGGALAVTNLANGGSNSGIGASSNAAANLVLGGGSLQYTGATVTTDRSFTLTASTTSTVDVATAGTTLTFTGSTASTTGGLTKAGAGTLALAGPAAYTGSTTVNSGTLQIGSNGTTGSLSTSSALTGSAGATLAFNRTNTAASGTDFATTIGGAINVAQIGSGTLVFSGANTYTGTTTLSAGSLLLSNTNAVQNSTVAVGAGSLLFDASVTGNSFVLGGLSGTGGINLRNNAGTPASITLTAGGNNASTTYQGVITSGGTGSSTFTKQGSGTLTLDPGAGQSSSVGAFSVTSGGVRLASGTLSVTAANSLRVGGANAPTFTLDGGRLLTSSQPYIGGDFGGRGTFTLTSGTWTNAIGFISIKFGVTGDGSVMNVNGGLVDSPQIQLGQNGGTSTLNLNGGVVAVDTLFNTALPTSVLNLNGGTLRAKSTQANFINLTSGSTSTVNVLAGGAIIDTNSFDSTILMPLLSGTTNDGGLTKQNAGTLTLSATNTFTGATLISGGTLAFDRIAALATTSGITIGSGAGLTYTGVAGSFDRNITVSSGTGTVRNTGAGSLALSGTLSKNGTVLRLQGGSAGINVAGIITGANPGSDLAVQSGLTTLSTANSYTGPTFINSSGTLALGVNNAIPSNSAVTIGGSDAGGNGGAGRFNMGSYTNQIGSLSFSGSGGTIAMAPTSSATSTVILSATGAVNLGGTSTLDLTGMATGAGLYRLIAGSSLTGVFSGTTGLDANYVLRYGTVNANEISAQMKANQLPSFTLTPASSRVLVGGSTTITGSLVNSSPSGATALAWSPTVTGSLTDVSSSLGSSITAGGTSTITATFRAGNTAGSQSWSLVNTDNNAITTSATSSGLITVVNDRTFTSSTISFGRFLNTVSALSGSATVTSLGVRATTADATINGFASNNGLSLSLASAAGTNVFNGASGTQTATYAVSGAYTGGLGGLSNSFTGTACNEFGTTSTFGVTYTGTAFEAASITQNQSSAGNTDTISITNAAGSYRSAAYVASTSLTGHSGWSVTGFGTGSSAAAGATLAGTAYFNAAGLLSGTYTGLFTAALQNDQTLGGAAANDLGSLSWNLSQVVLNTSGSGQATLAANALLNTVSLTSGTGTGATFASFAAGEIGASPSTVMMSFTSGSSGQYSDILHLQGTDGLAQVLQLTYDPSSMDLVQQQSLLLGWLDTRTGSVTNGQWINSVLGNSGTSGVTMDSPFLGSWATYASISGKTAATALGAFGVDTTTNTVWAAINHNSQFVVIVPEPNTIIFAGIGIAMAGWTLWKRRRVAQLLRRPAP